MGSHTFSNVVYTTATAQQTYRTLCDEAAYARGHDGYNGTIGTTDGVRVLSVAPMTLAQAQALSTTRIDALSKWDACEAIPLVAETPAEYESLGTQQVTVTVSGAVYNDPAALRTAITKALKVKAEAVDTVQVSLDRATRVPVLSAAAKVTATAAKAKTETRFFIITSDDQRMPSWEHGHPTQSAARAALDTVLRTSMRTRAPVECEVISMTRRVTGEPLIAATVEAKTVTATFDVSLRRVTKKATTGTVHAGWMFFGWAAD